MSAKCIFKLILKIIGIAGIIIGVITQFITVIDYYFRNSHHKATKSNETKAADARKALDEYKTIDEHLVTIFDGKDYERSAALRTLPQDLKKLKTTVLLLEQYKDAGQHLELIQELMTIALTSAHPHNAVTSIEKMNGMQRMEKLRLWLIGIYKLDN
jgi:hypothetical protein